MKSFKVKNLATALALTMASTYALSAGAVYNLYKSDGFSLDINGEINLAAKRESNSYTAESDGTAVGEELKKVMLSSETELEDKRIRLGQETGASWTEFRASQQMNNDYRATATIGFGYYDRTSGLYLNTSNLVFDKKDVGSVSFGRQYLHTAYVGRTSTYTPLDVYTGRSVRADYTAIPNLHVSAYYASPDSDDVRKNSPLRVEGHGISASYIQPLADNQSLRVAAGYTKNRSNPDKETTDPSMKLSTENLSLSQQSALVSLEYRNNKFLAAADYGKSKEDISAGMHDSFNTDYRGVKLGYAIAPNLTITAGYGQKHKKAELTSAAKNGDISQYTPTAVCGNSQGCLPIYKSYLLSSLFNESKAQRRYVQADYYLRDNVRLYGRYDQEQTNYVFDGKEFSTNNKDAYRVGVSLMF